MISLKEAEDAASAETQNVQPFVSLKNQVRISGNIQPHFCRQVFQATTSRLRKVNQQLHIFVKSLATTRGIGLITFLPRYEFTTAFPVLGRNLFSLFASQARENPLTKTPMQSYSMKFVSNCNELSEQNANRDSLSNVRDHYRFGNWMKTWQSYRSLKALIRASHQSRCAFRISYW